MDHVISKKSGPIKDGCGRVIVPAQLVDEVEPRMSALKVWIGLASMLEGGDKVLKFENTDELAKVLKYNHRRSIYQTLRKLEELGWISRTKGINNAYRSFEIEVKNVKQPPV